MLSDEPSPPEENTSSLHNTNGENSHVTEKTRRHRSERDGAFRLVIGSSVSL